MGTIFLVFNQLRQPNYTRICLARPRERHYISPPKKNPYTNGFIPVMTAPNQQRRERRFSGKVSSRPRRLFGQDKRLMRSGLIPPASSMEHTYRSPMILACQCLVTRRPGNVTGFDELHPVRNPSLCANHHKKGLNSRFGQAITLRCQGRSNNNRNEV